MDKEMNVNEEAEPAKEMTPDGISEQKIVEESVQKVEPIAVSDSTDMTEIDIDLSKPTDSPKSFDIKPVSSPDSKKDTEPTIEKNVDQGVTPIMKAETKKSSKKIVSKLILIIVMALLVASSAVAAYMWRDNIAVDIEKQKDVIISDLRASQASLQADLESATGTLDTTVIPADEVACTEIAPSATVIENIRASITSGNTAALEGYMAASVNVILAATEGVGPSTPSVAVSNITNFISTVTEWDFDLPASTLSTYSSGGYTEYFPSIAEVGKSTTNKVISFSFDCNGKIDTVFMAASGELI
jgi:hypothetical protein